MAVYTVPERVVVDGVLLAYKGEKLVEGSDKYNRVIAVLKPKTTAKKTTTKRATTTRTTTKRVAKKTTKEATE